MKAKNLFGICSPEFTKIKRVINDEKYCEVLEMKRAVPELELTYICRKMKINRSSFMSYVNERNINMTGWTHRKIGNLNKTGDSRYWTKNKTKKYKARCLEYYYNHSPTQRLKFNLQQKNRMAIDRHDLEDSYVKKVLRMRKNRLIPATCKIPNEVIELKRQQLKLKRIAYEQN